MKKIAILAAGGTGGHLFPAQALADELGQRGWMVHLATDSRAKPYLADFPADEIHIIESATLTGKSPLALLKTASRLINGYLASRRVLSRIKPNMVVGFGGYPTVPPLLAAAHKNVPAILHEQNAVMGRANKFLASKVKCVATGFQLRSDADLKGVRVVMTGNPLRALAHKAAKIPFATPGASDPFNLLVFGGSQGARFFSKFLPNALALVSEKSRRGLIVTLQSRPEDKYEAEQALEKLNIPSNVQSFFADLPQKIADSQLVMCRSGASSVAELALIGRPSILVPLPGALDDDQGANAAHLDQIGGATLIRQKDLTPELFSRILTEAIELPDALAVQAEKAKSVGIADAAIRLADLVEQHASH